MRLGLSLSITRPGSRRSGKTYYIDYKNGNNTTGSGATGAPWQTLQKALATVASGDTIKVRGSAADATTWYREGNLSTTKSSLTIIADDGHTPVFVHSINYASWSKTDGQTNVYETAYTPAAFYGAWNGSQYLAKVADVATCDATANSAYADTAGDKLYVNIGGDAPASIEAKSVGAKYLDLGGSGNRLIAITMQYIGNTTLILSGSGNTVSGMTLKYGSRVAANYYAIQVTGAGNYVSSCTYDDIGYMEFVEIQAGGSVTVTDCSGSGSGTPVHVYQSTSSAVVNGCTFSNSHNNGVYAYQGSAVVSNTTIFNAAHVGILAGDTGASIISNRCLVYTNIDPWTVYDDLDNTMHSYGYVAENGGIQTCYHCVAANGGINTLVLSDEFGGGFLSLGTGSEMVTRNCISYNQGPYGYYKNSTSTIDHDYCSSYSSTSTAFDGGPSAHDITDDPLFTDPDVGDDDFTLQEGSPCIDAGIYIPGVNDGYSGSAPDIGFYERS